MGHHIKVRIGCKIDDSLHQISIVSIRSNPGFPWPFQTMQIQLNSYTAKFAVER